MGDLKLGTGNGKSHDEGNASVKSMDLAVEYSQAKSNLCPGTDKSESNPKTAEELYQALTDKNRAIEMLKRRLTNQQIQLGYYLHKNLATEAVLEFSNKCFPHLAEDSTSLSLAMYKFIRDTGGKTRLAQLREKLTDYNNRVHKALLRQEQLVRQGFGFDLVNDLRRTQESDNEEEEDDEPTSEDLKFAKKHYKSTKLELCSQLLNFTMQVRKELERFRACAENVIRLEEERNALVDRVFSLSADQRYGNLHVAMVDHTNLPSSTTSIRSVTSVSTNTTTTEVEGKAVFCNLGGALQDMESEAIQLLLLSEKQKNEFVIALEEARVENQQLKERLRDLEDAASDERVIQLQEKCNNIEKEVENMRRELETEQNEKERVITRMVTELENRDRNETTIKSELKKLKTTIELLRNERNSLRKKLETSSKIYTVQTNQNTSTEDIMTLQSEQVSQQDVDELTDLVVLQEEQIKDLLSIMSDLHASECDTSSFSTTGIKSEEESVREISQRNEEDLDDSGVYDPESKVEEQKQVIGRSQEEVNHSEEYHIYYDSCSDFTEEGSEDDRVVSNSPIIIKSKETSVDQKSDRPYEKSNQARRQRSRSLTTKKNNAQPIIFEREIHRSGLATTSLRVQAFDKDGKSESMNAVLECSSPVDGVIEMNNSSKLHLRLQCTSPQRPYEYIECRESCPYCTVKNISGDHGHSVVTAENVQLSREAKYFLSKQLNKIKSQLQTSKSIITIKKEIVQNLNEIYSQLFGADDEVMTQSTNQS